MVTNTEAVRAVTEGEDGHPRRACAPAQIYVDMSTASPANTRALAERVAAAGASMLDSPVSGTAVTVEQGKASLMVGGDAETFERARAGARGDRPEGDPRRPERLGGDDEDRDQPLARRADARVQRGRAARGEERDPAREGGRGDARLGDRLADGRLPRAARARAPGGGLVRLPHDAEGHEPRPRARAASSRCRCRRRRSRTSC